MPKRWYSALVVTNSLLFIVPIAIFGWSSPIRPVTISANLLLTLALLWFGPKKAPYSSGETSIRPR